MNDSYAGEMVVLIMSFFALIVPFLFFIKTATWASKGLGQLGKAMQSGMQRSAQRAGNLSKKAAMNSKYGQAAQQFMGQRKAIAQLKGKEALRGALNNNPKLARLMGGVGGKQYASRILDTENRRHESEQIQELTKGISLPMANAIARGQNLQLAAKEGAWRNKNNQLEYDSQGKLMNRLDDEDRVGISKLSKQGYIGPSGMVEAGKGHSGVAASAALEAIYRADDVTPEKVRGLGQLLTGAGSEANAKFTDLNRDLAVRNKSKNVAFAQFNDGRIEQFKGKKPDGILASGLQGMNKDALKPANHDLNPDGTSSGRNALLAELQKEVGTGANRDLKAVVERTRQTLDQSHQDVIKGLSDAMGFANVDEFKQLRNALNSGGGVQALPPQFRTAMGGTSAPTPSQQPTPPAQQPQLIVPHGPPGGGPSNRPRPSNFPPTGPPASP